jgi:hypothetical protein
MNWELNFMTWKQRPLKFRAYIPRGHQIYRNNYGEGAYFVINNWQNSIHASRIFTPPDGIKIVQFAEKKDIEKRELFEADIVKYSTGNKNITFFGIGFIKFVDGCYQIVNASNATMTPLNETLDTGILGNVFQNPEILEEAKNGNKLENMAQKEG